MFKWKLGWNALRNGDQTADAKSPTAETPKPIGDSQKRRADMVRDTLLGLFVLGVFILVVLTIYGLSIENDRDSMHFIGWAFAAAFMAYLFGSVLGLLFGLPTTRLVQVRSSPPVSETTTSGGVAAGKEQTATDSSTSKAVPSGPVEQAGNPRPAYINDVPYNESTSLEQIADWLTKIIVGLTLTQYDSWSRRFDSLATDLTAALFNMSGGVGPCIEKATLAKTNVERVSGIRQCHDLAGGTVPGGVLLAGYILLGFLMAYLWMRRYFIIEMVDSQKLAIASLQAEGATVRERQVQAEAKTAETEANARAAAAQAEAQARQDEVKALLAQVEKDRVENERKFAELRAKSSVVESEPRRELENTGRNLSMIVTSAQQIVPKKKEVQDAISAILADLTGTTPVYPNDPWRDRMGSKEQDNGFALRAKVVATPTDPNYFAIDLTVETTNDTTRARVAGTESAYFFLHPTFGTEPKSVAFGPDGIATLNLLAYGAFTVGVLLEDGTKLELNLANNAEAPVEFRQR